MGVMEGSDKYGDLEDSLLASLKLPYTQQDVIVMEYLLLEGHEDAARELAEEAGIPFPETKWYPKECREIMGAVIDGKVLEALEVVHKLDVKLSPLLKLGLLQSYLEALIADSLDNGDESKALQAISFARTELAPLVQNEPEDSPPLIALQNTLAALILPETLDESERARLRRTRNATREILARKLNKEIRVAFDITGEDSRLVKASILREALNMQGIWSAQPEK